jgi:voltage-gated potassium channel Kch
MARVRAGWREQVSGWRSRLKVLVYRPLLRFLAVPAFVVPAVVVIALVLGYVGLREYLTQPHAPAGYGTGFWDIVFYDLQLPVLSSAPAQGAGPYPVPLGIARILAPVSTFLAAVGTLALLLREQLVRLLIIGHAIVTGDSPLALELVRRLRQEKWNVVFISPADDILTEARQAGAYGLKGIPADATALQAAGVDRADRLYACAGDSIANLNIATLASVVLQRGDRPLSASILVPNAELGVAYRARQMGVFGNSRLRPDFFAVEDVAVRRLFGNGDYPVVHGAHVVIIGFGLLGRAVLRETARRRAALDPGPPVEVIIKAATDADVKEVTDAFPLIRSTCHIVCGDVPMPAGAGERTVFICLEDYEKSLREGLDIARATAGSRCRVVICIPGSSLFVETVAARGGLLADGTDRLSVFEVLQEACVSAIRTADFAERFARSIARSIHQAYVDAEAAKGATPATNPSMVPWESLSDDLRQANIDQAADYYVKVEAIGAFVAPELGPDAGPGFSFDGPEIELLAELEHERWVRERMSQGWTHGEKRDNDRKIHPDLVSWAILPEGEREKNREAIRAMPGILHRAGYQILRLRPDP